MNTEVVDRVERVSALAEAMEKSTDDVEVMTGCFYVLLDEIRALKAIVESE